MRPLATTVFPLVIRYTCGNWVKIPCGWGCGPGWNSSSTASLAYTNALISPQNFQQLKSRCWTYVSTKGSQGRHSGYENPSNNQQYIYSILKLTCNKIVDFKLVQL